MEVLEAVGLSKYYKNAIFWLFFVTSILLVAEGTLLYFKLITIFEACVLLSANIVVYSLIYMIYQLRDLNKRLKAWLRI